MTETYTPSLWQRFLWWLPVILKVHVAPGRTAAGITPEPYDELVIAWGGQWRYRIRKA